MVWHLRVSNTSPGRGVLRILQVLSNRRAIGCVIKLTGEFTQPMVQLYDHPEPSIHQLPLRALHQRGDLDIGAPSVGDELPVLRGPRLGLRFPVDQLLPQELQHRIDEVTSYHYIF